MTVVILIRAALGRGGNFSFQRLKKKFIQLYQRTDGHSRLQRYVDASKNPSFDAYRKFWLCRETDRYEAECLVSFRTSRTDKRRCFYRLISFETKLENEKRRVLNHELGLKLSRRRYRLRQHQSRAGGQGQRCNLDRTRLKFQ